MRKKFYTLCLVALSCLGVQSLHAAGNPFTLECSFDIDDEFTGGVAVPEGWKLDGTNLKRNTGTYFGVAAQSGDYILAGSNATSADIIFTPVMNLAAGEACDIEFYLNSPGGTPATVFNYGAVVSVCTSQDIATKVAEAGTVANAATTGWKKVNFTYTPEADGEFCFAIQPKPYSDSYASMCGTVAFDSFIVEGTEAVKEPKGTPFEYTYTFENDEDFPGISTLPAGWVSTGMKPYRRYTTEALKIAARPESTYVLGNIGATVKEDNLLITPLYYLEDGEEATFSFAYFASANIQSVGYGFKVYAAPSQNLEGATLIGTIAELPERGKEWLMSDVYKFTPATRGAYCFIISPFNETGYTPGGAVAFDDIAVSGRCYDPASEPVPPTPGPEPDKGEPEPFSLEANFDFDDDFADGANLPEGWKQDGTAMQRKVASFFGVAAQSGDKVLGATTAKCDEVLYTPVMNLVGGKPCTLEFYHYLGGSYPYTCGYEVYVCKEQSLTGATLLKKEDASATHGKWIKESVSYTPADDESVCFAIKVNGFNNMSNFAGSVLFDSFIIEGTRYGEPQGTPEIELDPNDENLADCIDLPYIEAFDGTNYDGTSYLPVKWYTTGSVTWVTAADKSLPAVVGDYYMIANHNTAGERDDNAYTPFFNLEAGKEYTITYHVYMQGNDWNDSDVLYLPTLDFTVGTEQDADFHKSIATFSQKCTGWVPQSHIFKPEKSGAYCFAFMLTGPTNSGYVFVDDLKITAEGLIARVEPSFMVQGLYSVMDNTKTITFDGHPIRMSNLSKYADTYQWTVEGAEPSTSTEAEPAFVFPTDGEYTIVLEATNGRGTRKTQRKINVQSVGKSTKADQALTLFNSNQDRLYGRGETPSFDSEPDADFITGFNHYYFDLAQRFDFSSDVPVKVKQLTLHVTDRRYRGMTDYFDDQRIRPFSLVIYGAKADGSLDEKNVLGRLDTTVGEALGSTGLGGINATPCDIAFEQPVEVTGTIYVAMHFDRGMEVVPQDMQLGRSYFASQVIKHGHGKTSLYVKPFDKPAASHATLNEWTTVDNLDTKMLGMGAYWTLWCSTYDEAAAIEAIGPEGAVDFAATFIGDDLCVAGTAAGDTVALYNLAGQLVAAVAAVDGTTTASLPALPAGVYVVKSGANTAKVVK